MKIHIDEQTTEVEAGRIAVIFSIIEDAPAEVAAPVETPAEVAPEASVEITPEVATDAGLAVA